MNTAQPKTSKGISSLLFDADPARVAQLSHQNPFDVIVVGSGMGGGVLAHSLSDGRQRVLLLERGDLLFTTHALNTTRPHADLSNKTGPTQDNDIVYGLLKESVKLTDESDLWTGGPLYCLGGRSNVWGLYIPRIDPKTMKEYYPPSVVADLVDTKDPKTGNYYKRAEFLMHNKNYNHEKCVHDEPLDARERMLREINKLIKGKQLSEEKNKEWVDTLMAAIDTNAGKSESIDVKPIVGMLGKALKDYSSRHSDSLNLAELHWALMGAQFNSKDRYEFPQGAFSSTDRILEAVFRTHKNPKSRMEHSYLTALHNSQAIELVLEKDMVRGVKAITATGFQHTFLGKKVVVCAGTLDSPALLLRSGIEVHPHVSKREGGNGKEGRKEEGKEKEGEGGKGRAEECVPKYTGVTDHNIYGFRFSLKDGGDIEAAKLQIEGEVATRPPVQAGGSGEKEKKIPFLLNICINADSFLSRVFGEEEDDTPDGLCTLTYEFRAPLNNNNYVALDVYTGQPILHIKNSGEEMGEGGKINPHIERTLSELNIFIEETIRKIAHKDEKRTQLRNERQIWKAAGLGCGAHELGTLPMSEEPSKGVVDENLKFHKFQNLYACDMSVLPVSSPANPSLTLVALALRLADHLAQNS